MCAAAIRPLKAVDKQEGWSNLIKILVVDDKESIRSDLKALFELSDDMEVIGEAANGYDAILQAQKLLPDVIIMDVRMPGISGVQACRELLDKVPGIKILMFTTFEEDEILLESLEAGACGYLLKGVSFEELEMSVKLVVLGSVQPIDGRIAKKVLQRLKPVSVGEIGAYKFMTALDFEILRGIAGSENNASIGERLGLGGSEFSDHVKRLSLRLKVASADELKVVATHIVSNYK